MKIAESRINTSFAKGDIQICVLSRFFKGVLVFIPVKMSIFKQINKK